MAARIVVVGSANTDMVVRASRIPSPGETVTGGTFFQADGGKGANQAVAAARLGAQVTFVARVGSDELGDYTIAGLRREGIAVGHVRRDPDAASGVALIVVDESGENAIAVAPGANARLSVEDVEAAREAIESADGLLLQLETPLETVEHAASIGRAAGVRVILDPAPARPLPDALLSLVDVLTPNEGEARSLATADDAAAAAAELLHRGVPAVVVTLGPTGALVVSGGGSTLVLSSPVEPVDSTAAGDAFSGALATALAEGLDLETAVRRACAAGALAATIAGARPSLPTRERVDALLLDA
jgi:ribokinase